MQTDYAASFSDAITAAAPRDLGGILNAILAMLSDLPSNLTPEIKATIKTAALAAYDSACVAIDLPRLPEWIEVRVEAAVRIALAKMLDSLLGV